MKQRKQILLEGESQTLNDHNFIPLHLHNIVFLDIDVHDIFGYVVTIYTIVQK